MSKTKGDYGSAQVFASFPEPIFVPDHWLPLKVGFQIKECPVPARNV
jgi:hypothetical protein